MSSLRIAPIVEGHGEVSALPELLRRIGTQLLNGSYIEVLKPIRRPRSKFVRPVVAGAHTGTDVDEVSRAVGLAMAKLGARRNQMSTSHELILMLLDSNSDCAKELAPSLLNAMTQATGNRIRAAVVLPVVEFESWFAAAAASLVDLLDVDPTDIPADPEGDRCGKAWIEQRCRGFKYSETVDQVRLTARMDLVACRSRAKSFDKLCRDLEQWAGGPGETR